MTAVERQSPKKRDAAATRIAILQAARSLFVSENYDCVGLREIAGRAGVDVTLISRYYGGKAGLFHEVLRDGEKQGLFHGLVDPEQLAEFLGRLVTNKEDKDLQFRVDQFSIMLRSASSPVAGEIIREHLRREVLEPVSSLIGGDQHDMKANLVLSILLGIGVLRGITETELAGMSNEERARNAVRFSALFSAAMA